MKNLRRIFAVLLAVLMLVTTSTFSLAANKTEITIIHTNDTHGRIDFDERSGELGFARVKTLVETLRKDGKNVLVFDAGDTLHGKPIANISTGENVVKVLNELGLNGMTLGNHDFNYGYKRIIDLQKVAKFPFLAANVVDSNGNPVFDTSMLIDVDGVKVGVFGLATGETKTKSNPKNTEGLTFKDPVEVGNEMVKDLKDKGANLIVVLSHLGLDETPAVSSDVLASRVEGIDLIIDGHSHTKLDAGKQVGKTLIVQTDGHIKSIGKVDLVLEDGKLTSAKASLLPYETAKDDLKEDEGILKLIEEIKEENKQMTSRVVGKTDVLLDGTRENVRTKETNLGNLTADAIREHTGADFAFTNGGGIRSDIGAGDVTLEGILTAFPFTNYAVMVEAPGKLILEAMEYGIDEYPEAAGKFPQISGGSFKFDPKQEKGKRLYDFMIGGKPLELDKMYKLATNDFIQVGGDGYEMFKSTSDPKEYALLSDILSDYMKAKATVSPKVEDRIVVAEKPVEKPVEEPVTTGKFTDIENHWGKAEIEKAVELGLFKGTSADKFSPNVKLTRGMFIEVLFRLDGSKAVEAVGLEDVKETDYYFNSFNWAFTNKLLLNEGKKVNPREELSREEMAYTVYQYMKLTDKLPAVEGEMKDFSDSDQISEATKTAVDTLVKAELLKGKGDAFDPKAGLTRAEAATVFVRIADTVKIGDIK